MNRRQNPISSRGWSQGLAQLCALALLLPWRAPAQTLANASSAVVQTSNDSARITYYPLDQRPEFSVSLNGTWKFKLGPVAATFSQPEFDDHAWGDIRVPGNWELQGFEPPAYGKKPADTEGFYRHVFTPPAAWQGRRVFLRFEGVGFGFEFWLNGKRVGEFGSSFNRSEFDISDYVTPGRPCTLAVRVQRRNPGWEFDTNDDWALSGIHRDVVLFSLPNEHVKDYTVTTPVSGSDPKQATVRLKTWLESFSTNAAQATFKAEVRDPAGALVGSLVKVVDLRGPTALPVEAEMPIAHPQLWTAETPTLYRLELDLEVHGQAAYQVTQRIGLRSTTIEHGVFKLNGQPVKFRGVNHHDMHPATGRAMTRAQYIADLELMKAANINAIRMSHYPPQPMFLDLCDEYGIYVIDEVPIGFGEHHLNDEAYAGILALRARATVNRDKNQTCVLVWTVGNENPYTPLIVRTAGLVKALDPSRPRCLAHPTGKYYFELPPELDLVAPHYLAVRREPGQKAKGTFLEDIFRHPECTAPVLLTEYSHAAGTAMEDLKSCWEMMQSHDRFMGGCIWHFQDQGLYRKVPAGLYPGLPKMTDTAPVLIGNVKAKSWVAPDCVIDTSGQEGADGILDADRVPQGDYWAVRKVYSPVVIPLESLPIHAGRQALTIPIENRYDFSDLCQVSGTWELRVDGRKVQGGGIALKTPARQQSSFGLNVEVPPAPESHDLFLHFAFRDASGRELTEHTVRLLPAGQSAPPYQSWLAALPTNAMGQQAQGPILSYTAGHTCLQVNRKSGAVQLTVAGHTEPVLKGLALRVGREPQMSELRAYRSIARSDFWTPYLLTNATLTQVKAARLRDGQAQVDLVLQFARGTGPGESGQRFAGQAIQAEVQLTLSPQGWLDIRYTLSPKHASDYLLELGLALELAAPCQRLTWLGKGPYPVYPAQPESMERGVYSVAPQAPFDPVNRLYPGNRTEVDLAAVTDATGTGLGAVCHSATVSVEPAGDTVFFSHLALVAGHGEKRSVSVVHIKADDLTSVSGALRVLPLTAGQWPAPFQTVLANPEPGRTWLGAREANPAVGGSDLEPRAMPLVGSAAAR